MPTLPEHDHRAIVVALRSVLRADAADVGRPGRLRLHLDQILGPDDAHRLRRLVHQVVAASEDNLQVNLTRIAPLTAESLQRLSGELAESRGWTTDVACRTTYIWASALGFEELVASSWPGQPGLLRPAPDVTSPLDLVPPTALPPGFVPSGVRPPLVNDAEPRIGSASAALPPHGAAWPAAPRRLARVTSARSSDDDWGVAVGYSGMPLIMFGGLLAVLLVGLCTPVLFLGSGGLLFPLIGFAAASLLLRGLGVGVLNASPAGLRFTPYDGPLRRERADKAFSVPWSRLGVSEGFVSRLDLEGRRVQIGPRQRAFVRCVAAHAGREE